MKQLFLVLLLSSLALGQPTNPLFMSPPKLELGQVWKVAVQDVGEWTILVNRRGGEDNKFVGFIMQSGDSNWRVGIEQVAEDHWWLRVFDSQRLIECSLSWDSNTVFDPAQPIGLTTAEYGEQERSSSGTTIKSKTCSLTLEQIGVPLPTPHPLYMYPPKLGTGQRWTVEFAGLGTWSAVLSRGNGVLEGETIGTTYTMQAEWDGAALFMTLKNRQRTMTCGVAPQIYELDSSRAFEANSNDNDYRLNGEIIDKPCRVKLEQTGVALSPTIGAAPTTTPNRSSACNGKTQSDFVGKLNFLGVTRQFEVRIPQGKTIPALTFIFHGRTNPNVSFINLNADTVQVYPLGMPNPNERWWNAKDKAGNLRDYKFFDAMLEYLRKNVCFDQKRIYAIGYSLGATFVNSLGCVRPVIRAFATLGGGILEQQCPKPVAAIILHSPRDELVSIKEGMRVRDVLVRSNKLQNKFESYPKKADLLPLEDFSSFKCQRYLGSVGFPVVWCPHELSEAVWGQFGYYHAWMKGTNELIWKFFSGLSASGGLSISRAVWV